VSEGQRRRPLKHNHGIRVLEDLRTGQEGTVRGLPVVNCSGETEEGGGGTYRQQNRRWEGWTRGRGVA
jgi:hypothetical protein